MINPGNRNSSQQLAQKARKKLAQIAGRPTGCHMGGALSVTDILAVLFSEYYFEERGDAIILSKGHTAAALYAVLYETGRCSQDPALDYGAKGSIFTGHPHHHIPGVLFSTGSLGHGPSLGLGWALAQKLKRKDCAITYIIMGDGELQEGSCWEAMQVMIAQKLHRIVLIIDRNGGQNDGFIDDICPLGDLMSKGSAFGFQTKQIDGHSHQQIQETFSQWDCSRPLFLIAETCKGKGIKSLENDPRSHYVCTKPAIAQQWIDEVMR